MLPLQPQQSSKCASRTASAPCAAQGEGKEGQLEERPLTLQEAHSLKADTWRNTNQRCAATEARCAALAAAQAQASEHAFQAVRLGLAGLQEEVGRLGWLWQIAWHGAVRAGMLLLLQVG